MYRHIPCTWWDKIMLVNSILREKINYILMLEKKTGRNDVSFRETPGKGGEGLGRNEPFFFQLMKYTCH